jgi:hypothetical protein
MLDILKKKFTCPESDPGRTPVWILAESSGFI